MIQQHVNQALEGERRPLACGWICTIVANFQKGPVGMPRFLTTVSHMWYTPLQKALTPPSTNHLEVALFTYI
jgi:hypothetical protein